MIEFIKRLKYCLKKNFLTVQEYRTLKGQASHGDLIGAERGLNRILERSCK